MHLKVYTENEEIWNFIKSLRETGDIEITSLQGHFPGKGFEQIPDLFQRSIVLLPVWLGSTRTRPPQTSPPPLDSILPMQILSSSFHHFTETDQGFDKITFISGK
ncbi:UNVERIFIED_CONTAM: hypothetical protein NCL1_10579 [Trichonephila clavipes]